MSGLIKRLVKISNSRGVILNKCLLELLQIEDDTDLKITITKKHNILIEPLRKYKK